MCFIGQNPLETSEAIFGSGAAFLGSALRPVGFRCIQLPGSHSQLVELRPRSPSWGAGGRWWKAVAFRNLLCRHISPSGVWSVALRPLGTSPAGPAVARGSQLGPSEWRGCGTQGQFSALQSVQAVVLRSPRPPLERSPSCKAEGLHPSHSGSPIPHPQPRGGLCPASCFCGLTLLGAS